MKRTILNTMAVALVTIMCLLGMQTASHAVPAHMPPGTNPADDPAWALGTALPPPSFDNGILKPSLFGNTPNWNLSPVLQKFVDTLSPLGCTTTNNLGQCIPVATPDTITYPGSDYYEIELVQYTEFMHSKFKNDNTPTTLRGYRQYNFGTSNGQNTVAPNPKAHYLGPIIVAKRDRAVRIKFTNNLPTTPNGGNLFLPVDTTVMGSGKGPMDAQGRESGTAGSLCSFDLAPGTTTPIFELGPDCASYPQNRAELHLHGGFTPWISDGTPHQWITPAGEVTPYKRGASYVNVSDMPDPGPGSMTYFYSNQQSARLMFYHDHAYGLTRLNVYAGEAAGYLITDDTEAALTAGGTVNNVTYQAGTIPADQIPLVIQDKNFVNPDTIGKLDPTWSWGTGAKRADNTTVPKAGDLWWPHVYMTAENPYDLGGVNPMGRWVYGLWFWPPTSGIPFQLTTNPYYDPACHADPNAPDCVKALVAEPPMMPMVPNPSWTAEAFMDTMMVNGTVYPTITIDPKAYRLRILNAAHDRFLNLQIYKATTTIGASTACTVTNGGSGYAVGDYFYLSGGHGATPAKYAQDAEGTVTSIGANGAITGLKIDTFGSHYVEDNTGTNTIAADLYNADDVKSGRVSCTLLKDTEVAMVPAVRYRELERIRPNSDKFRLPFDNRDGGIPDPTTAGPQWIQIGTEGGFLPKPVVHDNLPVTYLTDPTQFNVGNVIDGTLRLGAAERADVIMDFSPYAGQTLIIYNDAPAAYPAFVANNDYYTGAPDMTDSGGSPGTEPGFGPNTRTIMQIKVANTTPAAAFNLTRLETAFKSTGLGGGGVFEKSQEPIIVGQTAYDEAYNQTYPPRAPNWGVAEIGDYQMSYADVNNVIKPALRFEHKAIHDEMGAVWDEYGRMSAKLGVEVPVSTNLNQTFVMQNYVDPPTEILHDGEIQIWKITHNGVDTHPMHFHLFDVQLINRVGWDGFKRLPDANELGWKETVKVSPLEDTIVALRPRFPSIPFGLPDSVRRMQPALPAGTAQGFINLYTVDDPNSNPPKVVGQAKVGADRDTNKEYNYGDEFVWHCHILSHEEQDMMRPMQFMVNKVAPNKPTGVAVTRGGVVSWTDPTPLSSFSITNPSNPQNEVSFVVERCPGDCLAAGVFGVIANAPANSTTYADATVSANTDYTYRVITHNAAGNATSDPVFVTTNTLPTVSLTSPADGAYYGVGKTIPLAATASAIGGVAKVEFYDNGVLIPGSADTTSPYSFNYSTNVTGTHVITAVVTDMSANPFTATSNAVSVNVIGVTLTPQYPSPHTAPVTFTAAVQGTAPGPYEYRFVMDGTTRQNYSSVSTWTMPLNTSVRTHNVVVDVRTNFTNTTPVTSANIPTYRVLAQPPTVTLTAPVAGSLTAPVNIALAATATANAGTTVNRVEFYDGATLLNTDTTSAYGYTWNNVPVGTHVFTARAYDSNGNWRDSASTTVTVNVPAAPAVTLTAPANNATFVAPAAITFTATATPATGATISRVDFYNGATLVGTAAQAPYSFTWSGVTTGSYTLTAKAVDNYNSVGTSAASTVTVNALPQAAAAPWISVPASASIKGVAVVFTGASSTAGAVYNYEISADNGNTWTPVTVGGNLTTSNPYIQLPGSGSYKFRVYVTAAGYLPSAYTLGTVTCVYSAAASPVSWISVPATANANGVAVLFAGASPTVGAIYNYEISADNGITWTPVTTGGNLTTLNPYIQLPGTGTYNFRVYVTATGFTQSSYVTGQTSCVY